MGYQLLGAFRALFSGQAYLHRRSNLGDWVAMHLYEDLHAIRRSKAYVNRVDTGVAVLNTQTAGKAFRPAVEMAASARLCRTLSR